MSVTIETGFDPMAMAEQRVGTGVQIGDAGYQGDPLSAGPPTTTDGLGMLSASFSPRGSEVTMQINLSSDTHTELVTAGLDGVVDTLRANGAHAAEMDGFTVTLTFNARVNPGAANTVCIGTAIGGDSACASTRMIAGQSVQAAGVAPDDPFDSGTSGTGLFITGTNDVPVTAGSQVRLDGDQVAGDTAISYAVTNGSDDGVVHGQIARFVAGAQIATEQGMIAVEALQVGDRVFTLDHGLQTLRWVGRRTVASIGANAAVSIPADTFGTHDGLRVSPHHRILLTGWQTELLSGTDEVLVKAIDLVGAGLLRQDCSGCPVTYCHLLFDRHEIINAAGLWSESYLLNPHTLSGHDTQSHAELCNLFPARALNPNNDGPAARAGFLLGQP